MQPKAMAGVPNSLGYVAVEKRPVLYTLATRCAKTAQKKRKSRNKSDVIATSATPSFPATLMKTQPKTIMKIQPNPQKPSQKPM